MPELAGRIILVRHGETEANRLGCFAEADDISLTTTGQGQAETLASMIQEQFQPARVFSSEFRRARQTAGIIARRMRLQAEVIPGLHERNFGTLKGRPYERMGSLMQADPLYDPEQRWLWAPEGGESLQAVQTRALCALKMLQTAFPDGDLIVVSHGAVMESVAAHLTGDWANARVPDNCGVIVIDLAL
jgi:broad specificity phosphatase PhoE